MSDSGINDNLDAAIIEFRRRYGDAATSTWRAPARLNVLGEHVDYVSYIATASLAFASSEHQMLILVRANELGRVRGSSTNLQFREFEFDFSEAPCPAGGSWFDYVFGRAVPEPHWSNYVKGAVYHAVLHHGIRAPRGFDFLIHSTIPPQGGSSSSSALVVLAGAAFREVNQIPFDNADLALQSSAAEWYVGTRGGALDHSTICLGRRHHAVLLSYSTNDGELVPLASGKDDGFRWVTFFSHPADKGREVMLAYNERAAVSRLLIPALAEGRIGGDTGRIRIEDLKLPETISLEDAARAIPGLEEKLAEAFPVLWREGRRRAVRVNDRARHHIGEVKRVTEATRILRSGLPVEQKMAQVGKLLNASHASLRDLYQVSTPIVDQLYDVLSTGDEVLGGRLIGGGFGGNVLVLTTASAVDGLINLVQRRFYAPQGRNGVAEGAVMVSTPGDGLSMI